MAVVHAGWHEELDRPVAVKVLAAHLADDPAFRTRFLREARVASRLQHPNLVRVFDIAELDGLPAIVMELVAGGTLEGEHLSLEEGAQIADGLAHAHANGVIHRDLKPANLLRARDGTIKIADFGIARALEDTRLTQAGTVLGTLRYLAPEQAEGRDVSPAADVYSLGVVLDELLGDARPRRAADAIRAALEHDPYRRPTAAAVAAALRGGEATTRVHAAPARVPSARERTVPSRGVVWALLGSVVIAAIVIVLVASSGGSPRREPGSVDRVPHASGVAQQARNLRAWLRVHSR